MSRKSKVSFNIMFESVLSIKENRNSVTEVAKELGLSNISVRMLLDRYDSLGLDGLKTVACNSTYTSSLKESAVLDYLNGLGSLYDICKKYGIRSKTQLRNWIMKYNSHEKLKTSGTGGTELMTNGHKTTYDERIEIVQYCIEHHNNYAVTAEKYRVSYQQVYTWMKKYQEKGIEGLLDRRGRTKPENEMSDLEKLWSENRLPKAQNKRQEMEMAFLKKLDEIKRRRF